MTPHCDPQPTWPLYGWVLSFATASFDSRLRRVGVMLWIVSRAQENPRFAKLRDRWMAASVAECREWVRA